MKCNQLIPVAIIDTPLAIVALYNETKNYNAQ